jgi:cell division protein FtsW
MRLVTFLDPWKYLNTGGAQVVQSYYAIARGGLFGAGLGQSIAKTGYLPEANTDFIMPVIAEEIGAIGVLVIFIILAVLLYRIIRIGQNSKDLFGRYVVYGVAGLLFLQAIVNFGGISGALPITGVVFPFISYGGSSFLTYSIGIGLVMNVAGVNVRQRGNS